MRNEDVCLWLSLAPGIGGVTIRKLYEQYGTWQGIWEAQREDMLRVGAGLGLRKKALQELCQSREGFEPQRVRRDFEGQGIRFVAFAAEEYPDALRELYDPPVGLYVAGELPPVGDSALAVVGSRTPTAYGRLVAQEIAAEVAGQGVTIVSGLARGIDTVAHVASVQAGGKTIAVLGSGLLNLYPKENASLARQIAVGHGAVISEFPPHTVGKPGHFPIRNRIISGLSQSTLVVEAGAKSGSLITADQALEQGRDVYAIPGPINSPQSQGTNRLIQQGAKLVQSAEDILEDFGRSGQGMFASNSSSTLTIPPATPPLPLQAVLLLDAIGFTETHIDELLHRTGWDLGTLHTWLLKLQVQGLIGAVPGGKYARTTM